MDLFYRTLLGRKKRIMLTRGTKIAISMRDDMKAAGYLMNRYLSEGWSVLVYSSGQTYYEYVYEVCPTALRMFTPDDIKTEIRWPFIMDASEITQNNMEQIIADTRGEKMLTFLKEKEEGENPYPDPNECQAFYQIRTYGIDKDKVLCEMLLAGFLSQRLTEEPFKGVVLFIDAPYRPYTEIMADIFSHTEKEITTIYMYDGTETAGDEDIVLYSDKDKIHMKLPDKKVVLYEQD